MSDKDVQRIIDGMVARGYALVPSDLLEPAMIMHKKRTSAMRKKALTPYEIVNLQLIPGIKTLNTIKNMVADGRIKDFENYKDSSGKLYITKACINRLNNE